MILKGNYMQPRDKVFFWNDKSYDSRLLPKREEKEANSCMKDHFPLLQITAEPACERVIGTNHAINNYLHQPTKDITQNPTYSFFPPLFNRGTNNSRVIEAQMTGGRTFVLTEESSQLLGIDPYFYLDLEKIGWGRGVIELRLEIKGAGSFLSKSKIDKRRFFQFIQQNDEFKTAYDKVNDTEHEILIISPADFLKRHIGGQLLKLAKHAVDTSSKLLGSFPIKFLPSIWAIQQSGEVYNSIYKMSSLICSDVKICDGLLGNDVRLTAGNVRAIYFDNAVDDNELRLLASRISRDDGELEETLLYMIEDVRKHIEILAKSSQTVNNGGMAWIKIGDINEMFEMDVWYRKQDYSHVLSKDEIIVNKVGKFFTDMESLYGKDIGYTSKDFSSMLFHHELALLCILKDHVRVSTKFAVAKELLNKNSNLSAEERKGIQKRVFNQIIDSVNSSSYTHLDVSPTIVTISLYYEKINTYHNFHIPRWQLAEPY